MIEIADHFSKYELDKVIFTKMDETGDYGSLFNLIDAHNLRLSYMTNGQNVPDDLLMADSERLCHLAGRFVHDGSSSIAPPAGFFSAIREQR